MGLFDFVKSKKERTVANMIELLDQHDRGEINNRIFLKSFGKTQVFYSTPFGNHKDGEQKVFLLPGPDRTGYHPVFSSRERLVEFYEKAGRVGYVIMQASFTSILETTKKSNANAPIKMGIIIDPGYYNVTVNADMLDAVIDMTK